MEGNPAKKRMMFDLVNMLKYHMLNLRVHVQGVWVYIFYNQTPFIV